MNFLLDTCAISETKQKTPNPKVLEWLDAQDELTLYLSALTIGEIRKGIVRIESIKRQVLLEEWLEQLRQRFSGRILSVTETTFLIWGKMYGEFTRKGIVRPAFDSLLEATALEHDLVLVTRNVKNFQSSQVVLLNPWRA